MEGTIKLDGEQVEGIVKSYFERTMFVGDIRVIRVHSPSWHSLNVEIDFTDEPAVPDVVIAPDVVTLPTEGE